MLNRVILIGRLTADPEMRYTPSGVPVLSFSLAVERNYKSQSGEKITDFINCVVWRKPAEILAQYTKKGYMIAVEGTLQQEKYQTKEGENRTTYRVQVDNFRFLDRGGQGGGRNADSGYAPSDEDAPPEDYSSSMNNSSSGDDDLPF